MERTLNFDIVTDENGYSYYMIPKDTLLYRGDTTLYPHFQDPKLPAFFSTEAKFVKHYGILFTFITTAPMKLLILDNHADYTNFYNNAPNDVKTVLRRNFGYESGLRDSAYVNDFKVINHICSLNMDGYANDRMYVDPFAVVDEYEGEEDMDDRPFHPEVALCKLTNVKFVDAQQDVENYIKTYGKEALEKEVKRKRESALNRQDKKKRDEGRRRGPGIVKRRGALFSSPNKRKDMFDQVEEEINSDTNETDLTSSISMNSLLDNMTSTTESSNMSDGSFNSATNSPSGSPPSTPSTPRMQGKTLFESPPKKQKLGGKKSAKKKKQRKKSTYKKNHKKKTVRRKYSKKGRTKKNKSN